MSKLTDAQKRYIEKLQPGQRATGVVKSFQDFGAFVSIGLISGLLHNKNIRWGRVEHPEHHLRLGQKIEIIILKSISKITGLLLVLNSCMKIPGRNLVSDIIQVILSQERFFLKNHLV
ncbi:MAG: S1 RNA-binding domain-containing protein [Bacteroidetes bacterium]|nr:S1 RNA-binding domain-containing protein [Bacteroidota bacterium]